MSTLTPRMSQEEKALVRRMHFEQGMTPTAVAAATGRDLSTIVRNLQAKVKAKKMGRPLLLTDAKVDKIEATLRDMVQKADGKYEVTVAMLRRRLRLKACARVISDALHNRDIYFRKMRSKPRLTENDISERFNFAKMYRKKTKAWWCRAIHMAIDLKRFAVFVNAPGRNYAAQRQVRGAYRQPGQGLDKGYVTVNKGLKYNPGVPSALIAAGVGGGKVRLWTEIKGKWCGKAAATLYEGPLHKALRKAYPKKRAFSVLEDNDPSGFKSSAGIAAKQRKRIEVFAIPPRSPDLSVCDYAIWAEVNKRMREKEAGWPVTKKESRKAYLARLRKTATSLPRP